MVFLASDVGGGGNAIRQFYRYVFGIGQERNVGGVERAIRYSVGSVLSVLGLLLLLVPVFSGTTNLVVAGVVLVSGLYTLYEARVQYCPLNNTLGRSTYRGDDPGPDPIDVSDSVRLEGTEGERPDDRNA